MKVESYLNRPQILKFNHDIIPNKKGTFLLHEFVKIILITTDSIRYNYIYIVNVNRDNIVRETFCMYGLRCLQK